MYHLWDAPTDQVGATAARETLALFWETLGEKSPLGDGHFSCSLAAGRMNRTIVFFLNDCIVMDVFLSQDMYCVPAARKSTCGFVHCQFIFPLCLEIMLACWKIFVVRKREPWLVSLSGLSAGL